MALGRAEERVGQRRRLLRSQLVESRGDVDSMPPIFPDHDAAVTSFLASYGDAIVELDVTVHERGRESRPHELTSLYTWTGPRTARPGPAGTGVGMARPTGFNRVEAISIRIPIEGADGLLAEGA